MRERPILFSGAMVRAIFDGTKTQTRRVVQWSGDPAFGIGDEWAFDRMQEGYRDGYPRAVFLDRSGEPLGLRCPYGMSGDRLWVRESVYGVESGDPQDLCYRVACPCGRPDEEHAAVKGWRPSIHMPRWASRITLEITDVRVQRAHEISEADARAEGVFALPEAMQQDAARACAASGRANCGAVEYFAHLWDSLNAKRGYGWDQNPWVWALTFTRVSEGARDA